MRRLTAVPLTVSKTATVSSTLQRAQAAGEKHACQVSPEGGARVDIARRVQIARKPARRFVESLGLDGPADQGRLGARSTHRHRADAAEGETRLADDAVVHATVRGEANQCIVAVAPGELGGARRPARPRRGDGRYR